MCDSRRPLLSSCAVGAIPRRARSLFAVDDGNPRGVLKHGDLVLGGGFKVRGSRFGVRGSGFRVQGSGFKV